MPASVAVSVMLSASISNSSNNILENVISQMNALSLIIADIQNQRAIYQNITVSKILLTQRSVDSALNLLNISYYNTQYRSDDSTRSQTESFVQYNHSSTTC